MTDRLLVIADDLTGALDTAIQFCWAGVPTFVTFYAAPDARDREATVLAVDTETRHLPPEEAARRVEKCVHAAERTGITRFYKKTDSTLRGNVGAELAALLRATNIPELYFVPALPDAGRTTRGGVQYVDGLPLHRSRYSRDAVDPVRGVSVADIIASQTDTAVVRVPRGVDHGPLLARARRPAILVFDAETNGDLAAIAGRLAAPGPPRLLAGCAGFASVVPGLLGLKGRTAGAPGGSTPAPRLRRPLLVVCGSRDEVSRSQLREAEARGIRCWGPGAADPARDVAEALQGEGTAMLVTGDSLVIACDVVRRIVEKAPVGTVAVFGGDTAFGVIQALGVHGMWPVGEICPGVVVSRLGATAMHLVTKAGGFGPVDVIQRIRDALEREE